MIQSLILTSLAFLTLGFGLGSDTAPAQDRCGELNEKGYPLYCSPTGPDAPRWAEEICCDGAMCVEVGTVGCPDDTLNFWCRNAEVDGEGNVTCLFEVPKYCDIYDCPEPSPGYQPHPASNVMCCFAEACYDANEFICYGNLYWCDDGVNNWDGTMTCFDDDTP